MKNSFISLQKEDEKDVYLWRQELNNPMNSTMSKRKEASYKKIGFDGVRRIYWVLCSVDERWVIPNTSRRNK